MDSSFLLHRTINKNILIGLNNTDWLRNMQIRFAQKKISDVLDILGPGSVSDKKAMDVLMDITCYAKLGYWKNNYKNYLTSLK